MATRHLTRWHVSWFNATTQHGPYAYVILHGRENHLMSHSIVSESFRIPITPDNKRDHKASKEAVKAAMKASSNDWKGHV